MDAATHRGIQSISLENFRALNTDALPMKPITVLCGTNSAGKSSFLKSALLMKQINNEANISKDVLPLKGKIVDLGTYKNLVKNHDTNEDITICLSFPCEELKSCFIDFGGIKAVDYELRFAAKESGELSTQPQIVYYKIAAKGEDDVGEIATVTVSYNKIANNYAIVGTGNILTGLDLNSFQNAQKLLECYEKEKDSPALEELNLHYPDAKLLLQRYKDFCARYVDDEERAAEWNSALLLWLAFDPEDGKVFESPSDLREKWPTEYARSRFARLQDASLLVKCLFNEKNGNSTTVIRPFLRGLTVDTSILVGAEYLEKLIEAFQTQIPLDTELGKIRYLGPIRELPQRYQMFSNGDELTLGYRGENAPYIMCKRQGESVKTPWYVDDADGTFLQDAEDSTLGEEVSYWTNRMGIGEVHCTLNTDNYPGLAIARVVKPGEEGLGDDFTDVGFGISQVFPILVGGLEMPEGSTMFIEQPEVHLHPGMQGNLADYFISTALSGKQYVIETHSDHIVNRLVRRIVEDGLEGESLGLADLVQIYFVDKDEDGETLFTPIEVDEKRGVIGWPDGFFDQSLVDTESTMDAATQWTRRKRQEAQK